MASPVFSFLVAGATVSGPVDFCNLRLALGGVALSSVSLNSVTLSGVTPGSAALPGSVALISTALPSSVALTSIALPGFVALTGVAPSGVTSSGVALSVASTGGALSSIAFAGVFIKVAATSSEVAGLDKVFSILSNMNGNGLTSDWVLETGIVMIEDRVVSKEGGTIVGLVLGRVYKPVKRTGGSSAILEGVLRHHR